MTRPRLLLAVVALAGGLAWLVERLVVTDAEAVEAALERAAADASRGAWDAVADAFDDTYLSGGRDKAAFLAWARAQWNRAALRAITVDVLDVRVEGDRAAARVEARLQPYAQRVPGSVDLERRDGAWRIVRVAPDETVFFGR
ncbi:MAG: hypothetical protein U1E39_01480 [Planctomycetota bacterium]